VVSHPWEFHGIGISWDFMGFHGISHGSMEHIEISFGINMDNWDIPEMVSSNMALLAIPE